MPRILEAQPAVVEDPETMVIYENREEGGGYSPQPPQTPPEPVELPARPSRGGGGGGGRPAHSTAHPAQSEPIAPIETIPAQDPADIDLQERLKKGDGTPEEALAYFQQHGYPELATLPVFQNGIWLFPTGAPGTPLQIKGADSMTFGVVPPPPAPPPPPQDNQPLSQPGIPLPRNPTPATAPGASPPSPPVPGSIGADRQTGVSIGNIYGEFRAWSESFWSMLQEPQGGVSAWDRMSPGERSKVIAEVQAKYAKLPALPAGRDPAHDHALREGFEQGAASSYSKARWENRMVWVAAELAKSWAIERAATPTPISIGSAFSDRFSDCAAQTASLILENTGNPAVPAAFIRQNFGLPRTAISSYKDAVSYAKNWFTKLGIELSPTSGGFRSVANGGTAGNYVVFFEGGASGGHVVYGAITAEGVRLVDGQLGVAWSSLDAAERALGMQAKSAYRVINVQAP